jgi:hypothetical protein
MSSFLCSGLDGSNGKIGKEVGIEEMDGLLSLNALCKFCAHARVHLDCRYMFSLLQYSYGQVACSRSNFEDFIGWTQIRLHGSSVSNKKKRRGYLPCLRY